jgi:hypothetical protein
LKLSTSSEALLLPGAALSALVRSSSMPLSCGSIDASVLAKGFAGTPLGNVAELGAWYALLNPGGDCVVAIPYTGQFSCVLEAPTTVSLSGRLEGIAGGSELAYSLCSGRRMREPGGASSTSSGSGCGLGIYVLLDCMRTCFFVRGGGAAARSSSPATLLLRCS